MGWGLFNPNPFTFKMNTKKERVMEDINELKKLVIDNKYPQAVIMCLDIGMKIKGL